MLAVAATRFVYNIYQRSVSTLYICLYKHHTHSPLALEYLSPSHTILIGPDSEPALIYYLQLSFLHLIYIFSMNLSLNNALSLQNADLFSSPK